MGSESESNAGVLKRRGPVTETKGLGEVEYCE